MTSAKEGCLVLWGEIDTSSTDEESLNDWWTNEHLPERLNLPGFKRARRYYSSRPTGSKIYLARYDVSNIQDLVSPEYMRALNNPTEGTREFMPYLARMNRSACTVVKTVTRHNLTGNWLVCMVLTAPERLATIVCTDMARASDKLASFCGFTNLVHDNVVTREGSRSASYQGVQFQDSKSELTLKKHIILVELSLPTSEIPPDVKLFGDLFEARCKTTLSEDGVVLPDEVAEGASWDAYQLLCSLEA